MVEGYIEQAASDNTRKAYRADLDDFYRFGASIPASPELVAQYIAFRAQQHSPHTITRRVVALGKAHRSLGYDDPSKTDLVRTVLRGVRRSKGVKQRQARPIRCEDIYALMPSFTGIKGSRDRALVLLGFSAALRRAEIVALDVTDLSFSPNGMLVQLRKSKTDQEGRGREVAVPFGRTSACPVRAVQAWLELVGSKEGAVFRAVGKSGLIAPRRLSPQSISVIVKAAVASIGLDSVSYSGHSLRSGFVTSAAAAGASVHSIMRQTGHKSAEMVARYIRPLSLFEDNAAGRLL